MSFKSTNSLAIHAIKGQVLSRAVLRPVAAVQSRAVSTQSLSEAENLAYLNKQRDLRPNSPWHIYKPQLTTVTSLANRGTGVFLSAAFYATFIGHLVLPAVGVPFGSAELVQLFADLPAWLQLSVKTAFAGPMAFHTINGFRHLSWDRLHFLNLKTSYQAGYAVLAATAVSTVALVML